MFIMCIGGGVVFTRSLHAWGRYALILTFFALGLMAKQMLVTLPFVMLLLDWWPLDRWRPTMTAGLSWRRLPRLVAEKLPFLAMAVAASALAFTAQSEGGAVRSLETHSLDARLANVALSYVIYLRQMVWPEGLAFYYPYRFHTLTDPIILGAVLLLLTITGLSAWQARARPYLLVGWLWYLGTLAPVSGLVQIGAQGHADHYTYVPMIGVLIAAVWGVADLVRTERLPLPAVRWGAGIALILCAFCTWQQIGYWHDTRASLERSVAACPDNHLAHGLLGLYLHQIGDLDGAIQQYEEAVRLDPSYVRARNNLGVVLILRGRPELALAQFEAAVHVVPENAEAHLNLASALVRLGKTEEALEHFHRTLALEPNNVVAHEHLGLFLEHRGQLAEAAAEFAAAAQLQPKHAEFHYLLGQTLRKLGRLPEACAALRNVVDVDPTVVKYRCSLAFVLYATGAREAALTQYEQASRLDPLWTRKAAEAAWALATSSVAKKPAGDFSAVEQAEQICQATQFQNAVFLDILAAAHANEGRFDEAVTLACQACQLTARDKRWQEARSFEEHMRQYLAGRPLRRERSPDGR